MSINNTTQVLCVMVINALVATLVYVSPGSGTNRRLDIRNGVESEAFQVSLLLAMKNMTHNQITAYNWAVSDMDSKTFVTRYGATPSVREVIVGQVMRFIDEKRRHTAELNQQFPQVPERFEAAKRSYQHLLNVIAAHRPVVTKVEYSYKRENGKPERALLSYKLLIPSNLKLTSYPCQLSWRQGVASIQQNIIFDCLALAHGSNGEYRIEVPLFPGDESVIFNLEMNRCFPEFPERCVSFLWDWSSLAIDIPSEIIDFWRLRGEMINVLTYKSFV